MILYQIPGGCSLASHIALIESGLAHDIVAVDREKRTSDGRDFLAISPKGCTPTLELDDGNVLTESVAILSWIAKASDTLLPTGDLLAIRVLEATSFMATDVHGSFKTFFYGPSASDAERDRARAKLDKHFGTLAAQLGERAFLVGDRMTIADPYLFVMLRWASSFGVPVPPALDAYRERMKDWPSFAQALAREGLS